MNPEIEKLIELALADGQLTEKERTVIINKGVALGLDEGEVELILDGKLYQLEASLKKSNKEKVGNIKTCPSCGASVKSMTISCEDCGHEFSNVTANNSISKLLNNINSLQKYKNEQEEDFDIRKAEIINNTAIPNSKEDLLEFLTVCTSQADVDFFAGGYKKAVAAWNNKASEALLKAKIAFSKDLKTLNLIEGYEKKLKKAKHKLTYFYVAVGIILLTIFIISKIYK